MAPQKLIAPDLVQADKWFRLAARSPWHDNPQIRASIEPHMTTVQLDEARRQAAIWHPLPLPEVMALDLPTGGSAHVTLALRGNRIVLMGLRVSNTTRY